MLPPMPRSSRHVVRFAWLLCAACGPSLVPSVPPAETPAPPANPERVDGSVPAPPFTEQRPVSDEYHGQTVTDPYRWLESESDPEVQAWVDAQNVYARSVLDALVGRKQIAARVKQVYADEHPSYRWVEVANNKWFVLVRKPPAQQPFVVVMNAGDDPANAKLLIDPNGLDPSGKTSIDWFVPSPDGSHLAVSLSKGGTESGDVSVYEVNGKKRLGDVVHRVNGGTAGGDLAWLPDGSGFYYTRYPHAGERPSEDLPFYQQVYLHRLGTDPKADSYEIGKELPRIAENQLDVDQRTGRVLLTVQNGDGGEFAHYLRDRTGRWRRFSEFGDKVVQAVFIPGQPDLLVLSRKNSPSGELVRVDGETLDVTRGKVVVNAGKDPLVSDFWGGRTLLATEQAIYATHQLGGPAEVRAYDHAGKRLKFDMPFAVASVSGLASAGQGKVLFRSESFVDPVSWFVLDEATRVATKAGLDSEAPVDMSGYTVRREFATSKDGTKVPLNILLSPNTARDGTAPLLVTGYGGYGVSLEPRFQPTNALWLEKGVTYVVSNLRGGGEYGEPWHRAGNLENKQTVFDDFYAVLQYLHQRGYSRPERTAIIGGSNGGLLMGATLVQHPEEMRAVVSFVGIYDMLRVELSPNGAFNVTEFGTVRDPRQYAALRAYSPYHNVRDSVAYPATLLLTGQNDPRVEPMQSYKMTARLQAANAGGGPILLRTSADTGHGGDTDLEARIAEQVDVQCFVLDALGVTPPN